ncbi:MAG TPA: S4 domain-containing protein [Candidatus Paceibacterota bacterium]
MKKQEPEAEPVFPMRINKYLAMEGRGSRRDMDKLVEAGRVLINDKVAELGSKVSEGDKVEIRFHKVKKP